MKEKVKKIKLIDLDDALTILFICLKLCHIIDWSWWLVLSPVLITNGIGLCILGVIGITYGGLVVKEVLEDFIEQKLKFKQKNNKKLNIKNIKPESKVRIIEEGNIKEFQEQYPMFDNLSTSEKIKFLEQEKQKLLNNDLSIRKKIEFLESEKAKLLNFENKTDKYNQFEKIKNNKSKF